MNEKCGFWSVAMSFFLPAFPFSLLSCVYCILSAQELFVANVFIFFTKNIYCGPGFGGCPLAILDINEDNFSQSCGSYCLFSQTISE